MTRFVLFLLLPLVGCVTGSPEQLLTPPPVLEGQGRSTGQFPTIGVQPAGQTAQLTDEEAAATKQQLDADANPGRAQAQDSQEARYRREVEELQKLAEQQRKRRLLQIESREF